MKRRILSLLIFNIIGVLACLIIAILVGLPHRIADYTENHFGPPSNALSIKDQIYLTAYLLSNKKTLTTPTKLGQPDVQFQVDLGETPISVSRRLYQTGLINNPEALKNYLIYSGLDTRIQAGEYILNPRWTAIEIARLLQDPTPQFVEFGILAGWRAEEIAAALPSSGLEITPQEFLDFVLSNQLEGYLFPGLYQFQREISTTEMVFELKDEFDSSLTAELLAGFETNGLNLHEAVILASIVEREAVVEDEMPLIASVFLNRLNTGIKLDADPTVQYAIGYSTDQNSWWTNPLSAQNLKLASPYNTYLHTGLPPGPICNPGINALKAVAFPAETPYYYFRASCDGSGRHSFSITFEEHIQKECP
jgi:UPF0755 protein